MTRDEVAEWLPILAAFAVGQQIQFRRGEVVIDWRDVGEQLPTLYPGMEFRIKPVARLAELERREQKYRPLLETVLREYKTRMPKQWILAAECVLQEGEKKDQIQPCPRCLNTGWYWRSGRSTTKIYCDCDAARRKIRDEL